MVALLLLGFASGLPLLLTSRTLQAWMTVEQVDLSSIGLFSLVALPYSLKFLWSPLLDRFVPPFLGRRRGWLVMTQVALVVAIAAMSLQNPAQLGQVSPADVAACTEGGLAGICELWQKFQVVSHSPLFWVALSIAFFSASQDIAFNAYQVDVLEEREMGAGAAVGVLGYRIALLVTGSIALILADQIAWPWVYLCLAGLMIPSIGFAIWAPEPVKQASPPVSLEEAVRMPFGEFFQRSGLMRGILVLGFIVLYKLGDALVNNMAIPFLLQTGFSQATLGQAQGAGLIATIVGTLAGGAILSQIGINRSLWIFGGLQALSNLSYFVLAQVGQNAPLMVLVVNIEYFCAGLGTAAFVAFLISLCHPRFSATQYALLSSLMAVSRDILVAPAGGIAEMTGWTNFFLLSLAAALPGLLLLPVCAPWNPPPPLLPRPGLHQNEDQPY